MCTDRYPYFQTYGQILNSNKYSTKYYDMLRILSFLIKKKWLQILLKQNSVQKYTMWKDI